MRIARTPLVRFLALLTRAAAFRGPLRVLLLALALPAARAAHGEKHPLKLDVFTGSEKAYRVTSTIIFGETESALVDAQLLLSDVARLADRIDATHTSLRSIFVTHPDPDHYLGLELLHRRFPSARIYMAPRALEAFRRTFEENLAAARRRAPDDAPRSVPTPEELPSGRLTVDGQDLLVVADQQGDVAGQPSNSFVFVPSRRAAILGDLAFRGVHPWLEDSTAATRARWRAALDLVRALDPRLVVAGHGVGQPETDLASVLFTQRYLEDFEAAYSASRTRDSFVASMKAKYPGLEQPVFLEIAARSVYAVSSPEARRGDGIGIAEARKAIEEGNVAWGRARVAIDRDAFEKALAPDFFVRLPDRRLTRQEFLERITHFPYGRLTRFDPTVLTVQPEGNSWVAIILEKLEYDQPRPDGSTLKGYTLAVTRDGWTRTAVGWQVLSSELLGAEMWREGTPPRLGLW